MVSVRPSPTSVKVLVAAGPKVRLLMLQSLRLLSGPVWSTTGSNPTTPLNWMSAVPSFFGTDLGSSGAGSGTAQLLGPPSSNSELQSESPAIIPPTSGAPP